MRAKRRTSIASVIGPWSILPIAILFVAGGASPLATQKAVIGPYNVLLSFYSLPRAGQAMNATVESARPADALLFSNAVLNPAAGTDGSTIAVMITPDGETPHVYDVQVTPPVRGKWLLHLQVTGPTGTVSGDIPIIVDGPPAIPIWLGWLIGLAPLPFILLFIAYQVTWRKRQMVRATRS
ncbi:MAG TPA: hypothetical protein VGT44_14155 [Ktedonobacteraceae bacterium]|nr:hypothetical protein [Ktedonobacteraceae bacterium]